MGRTKPPENCPAPALGPAPDPAAFDVETLVKPATHQAYRIFVAGLLGRYRIPHEHREDFVQDVMVEAAIRRHHYDPGLGTVRQWLTGFVRFKAFGYWRTRGRKPADTAGPQAADVEQALPSSGLTPEQTLYARRLLARFYDALSEPLRELFRLAAEGYTHEKIAVMTGLKLTTVESRLARVDKVLAQVLALLDEEDGGAPDVRLCAAPWALAGIAGAAPDGLAAPPSCRAVQWAPASAPLPLPASGYVPAFKLAAAGLALFAAGVAIPVAWIALRQREPAPAARAETVVAAFESMTAASEPPARPPLTPAQPPLTPAQPRPKPLTPNPTAAAEEASTLLLRKAHDAFQNGSPSEVVALVAEHRRRFPYFRDEERAQLLEAAKTSKNVAQP